MSNIEKHEEILFQALKELKAYKAALPVIAAAKNDYPLLSAKLEKANDQRLSNYLLHLIRLENMISEVLSVRNLSNISLQ